MDYAPKTYRAPRIDDRGRTTYDEFIMGMLIRYFPAMRSRSALPRREIEL